MLCFRDMTFCTSDCATVDCRRKLTDLVSAEARAWWGKEGAPIAVAKFSGWCKDYTEPTPSTGASE